MNLDVCIVDWYFPYSLESNEVCVVPGEFDCFIMNPSKATTSLKHLFTVRESQPQLRKGLGFTQHAHNRVYLNHEHEKMPIFLFLMYNCWMKINDDPKIHYSVAICYAICTVEQWTKLLVMMDGIRRHFCKASEWPEGRSKVRNILNMKTSGLWIKFLWEMWYKQIECIGCRDNWCLLTIRRDISLWQQS